VDLLPNCGEGGSGGAVIGGAGGNGGNVNGRATDG